jgi:hypothetical protein
LCSRPIADSTIAATTHTNAPVPIIHIRTLRRWSTPPARGSAPALLT